LLSKNVKPFIGYCYRQASKYGIKGSRLSALEGVIKILESFDEKEFLSVALPNIEISEYVKIYDSNIITKKFNHKIYLLDVLGAKFQSNVVIKHVLNNLRTCP